MKSTISILLIFFSLKISAQVIPGNSSSFQGTPFSNSIYTSENQLLQHFSSGLLFERGEESYLSESERINLSYNSFAQPSAPILTTTGNALEICTGSSTRLTATSGNIIYWYAVPPPLGTPVGTGTSYITPALNTGYYTYYAIAENNGIRSDISSMEVIMVYPNPTLTVTSNVNRLCSSETATLTVSGTTYYEWENGPVSSQLIIRPLDSQTYKVTGINTAGCKSTVEFIQEVELCFTEAAEDAANKKQGSPVSEIRQEDKTFSVFPNPNNGTFIIRAESISENTKVEIYNAMGELTYSLKLTTELSAVALTDSPNGIYIVRILENDKVQKQEKIVKY